MSNKIRDDIDSIQDFTIELFKKQKEGGLLKIDDNQLNKLTEIIRNCHYTASDSFLKKVSITNSIVQAFLIGVQSNLQINNLEITK